MKPSLLKSTALLSGLVLLVTFAQARPYQASEPWAQAKQHYTRAREFLANGDRAKAIEELHAAIQLSPEFVEAHLQYLSNQKSKASALVEKYQSYVEQNPNSALYHYLLGKAYLNASRSREADAELTKSLELDSEFSWTLAELGTQALNKRNQVTAVDLFEKARQRAGESLELHYILATGLARAKRSESALREAERMLEIDPSYFAAYPIRWRAKMGVTSGSEKTQSEIAREARRLEATHSNNVDAQYAAYLGYNLLFDTDSTERVMKAILSKDPKYMARRSGVRMLTTMSNGQPLEFSGPRAESYSQAQILKDAAEQVAALQKLEKEVEDPNIKLYFIYPAQISAYLRVGELENAEGLVGVMEKAGAETRLVSLRVDLARVYVDRKIKLDVAQDYLRKAIESDRKNLALYEQREGMQQAVAATKNSLARAIHVQGRLLMAQGLEEKAIEAFAESVRFAEQEANTLDLGSAYLKSNKLDEAIRLLVAAYSFQGPRKQEAETAVRQIYGDRENAKPLASLLAEAVELRKARTREGGLAGGAGVKLEGNPAPAFDLASLKGQKVRLADYQGKVVLLNFWATW